MIGSFFGEDRGVVGEFWGEGLLWFCLLGGGGEFSGSGDFQYLFFQRGAFVKKTGSTSDNSVEGPFCVCTGQELGFFFPPVVLEESGVSDCIDMSVSRGSMGRLLEVGIVAGGVGGVGEIEVFGLVKGFFDG